MEEEGTNKKKAKKGLKNTGDKQYRPMSCYSSIQHWKADKNQCFLTASISLWLLYWDWNKKIKIKKIILKRSQTKQKTKLSIYHMIPHIENSRRWILISRGRSRTVFAACGRKRWTNLERGLKETWVNFTRAMDMLIIFIMMLCWYTSKLQLIKLHTLNVWGLFCQLCLTKSEKKKIN